MTKIISVPAVAAWKMTRENDMKIIADKDASFSSLVVWLTIDARSKESIPAAAAEGSRAEKSLIPKSLKHPAVIQYVMGYSPVGSPNNSGTR